MQLVPAFVVLSAAGHLVGGVGGAVLEELFAPAELVVGAVKHLGTPTLVRLALEN